MNAHNNDHFRQAARAWLAKACAEIAAANGADRERVLKEHSRTAGACASKAWLDGTAAGDDLQSASRTNGLVRETTERYVGGIIGSEMRAGALNPPRLSPIVEVDATALGSLPRCERDAGLQPAPRPLVVTDARIESALSPIAHTADAGLYNENDVREFLTLLHNHVTALAAKLPQDCPVGKMQLVFIQPATEAVTERRYSVGNIEAMMADVRVYAHTHNVYIGGRTIRDDAIIAPGGRGTFEATGLVYALVVDDDTGVLRNDVRSTLHVKTSEGRCHKWLLVDMCVSPEAAAALGLRLRRFVGADHCTGSVAHIYRVPGTPNWPNAKKIEEGRKPEPTSLSPQRGEFWSPEAMLNTLPRVNELPQEKEMPQRPYVAPRDDDDEIIEKAQNAANADKFNVLWRGDRAEFNYGHNSRGVRYNQSAMGDVSDSMADNVFARMLALYTSDPSQIERLMRRSGLCRDKWNSRRGGGTWLSEFVIKSAIKKHAADAAQEAARADAIRLSVERAMATQSAPQGSVAPQGQAHVATEFKQKPPPIRPHASSNNPWPDPKPIPSGLSPVRSLELNCLPASIAPWVADIADRLQCPPDFVAIPAIVALGATLGRKIGIRPQRRTDWLEVPNMWGCIIGRPGALKSPAMQQVIRPLKNLEANARAANDEVQKNYKRSISLHKIQKEVAANKVREAIRRGQPPANVFEFDEPEQPLAKRYLTSDTSYEALGEILAANPNGVMAFRDELVSLLKTLDREEYAAARGFFLSAWNGNDSYTFDRIIRGRTHIEAACLSLLGSTQPGRIAEYMRRAIAGGAADDGLIQRFGLLVWPDQSPEWRDIDRYPDTPARQAAWRTFGSFDSIDPMHIGAQREEFECVPFLRFGDAAQDIFTGWRSDLEKRLRGGELHPALESHFSKYRKLVPSLALVNHLADEGGGPVSETAIRRAIAFVEYLETHATRAYGAGIEAEAAAAKAISKRIKNGDLKDGFTARELWRNQWTGLTDLDTVKAGLELLTDLHCLDATESKTKGRPRVTYAINPKAGR